MSDEKVVSKEDLISGVEKKQLLKKSKAQLANEVDELKEQVKTLISELSKKREVEDVVDPDVPREVIEVPRVSFFSQYRKLTIELETGRKVPRSDGRLENEVEFIKFQAQGPLGVYSTNDDLIIQKLREHPLYNKPVRGGFFTNKSGLTYLKQVPKTIAGPRGADRAAQAMNIVTDGAFLHDPKDAAPIQL